MDIPSKGIPRLSKVRKAVLVDEEQLVAACRCNCTSKSIESMSTRLKIMIDVHVGFVRLRGNTDVSGSGCPGNTSLGG
jgi:hypothetical protein